MNTPKDPKWFDVTVERVLPFGVFVRLQDGRRGYIRRRELDLDADVEPSKIIREGQTFKAIALTEPTVGENMQLSRRATLTDPWPEFGRTHQVGDVVRGTVRAIHPHGIFVRIQPGIDGFVSLREAVPARIENLESFYWIGDDVEAVILHLQKKHLELSIKVRMQQYDRALEASGNVSKRSPIKPGKKASINNAKLTTRFDSVACENIGSILVVEDDDHVRESLTTWLGRKGLDVSSAESVSQAKLLQLHTYSVFIVDLNLYDHDGLEFIRHLKTQKDRPQICVMSSPEILDQRIREIEDVEVVDVFPKPLDVDEIEKFLLRVAKNEPLPVWKADRPVPDSWSREATFQFSGTPILNHLQNALADITSTLRAHTGLLFQLDPDTHAISIPIQVGSGQINPNAIYGLRESPVKDVLVEEVPVFENRVLEKASLRFEKLLNLMMFKSCIGVPIHVHGEVHHAAFFFHTTANAFPTAFLRDAQVGALLLSSILTEESIQARLRPLNPLLLSGELAASFGHDVFNKITALELEALNLADSAKRDFSRGADRLVGLVMDLKETTHAFQQMLRTKGTMEPVDVNSIIQRTILLLRDLARKERTQIILKLAPTLPLVMGNSILLQQTFLNLMLNAIQQMTRKAEMLKWTGRHSLEITTGVKNGFLQVRFRDNGPGFHRETMRKIFMPGFSTRGGSGLGLYIARSFVQMLGGVLRVEETFIPLGSTLLVAIPVIHEK